MIGGKPILWHILTIYSYHGVNDFVICYGYKGHLIKEYIANDFLHVSKLNFDVTNNCMEGSPAPCQNLEGDAGRYWREDYDWWSAQASS